ncbi:hypothetical protein ANCCAN_07978 [Ancylostoma caninum]|uniref:Uncharacterized protein n=1 Tax=Ancylostoma caninum TaxID=29170 RepID=A0A368GNT8_ANCCA|nr:hypothetical protein ANCCAN_07978 [Ancylostoma caninum]
MGRTFPRFLWRQVNLCSSCFILPITSFHSGSAISTHYRSTRSSALLWYTSVQPGPIRCIHRRGDLERFEKRSLGAFRYFAR